MDMKVILPKFNIQEIQGETVHQKVSSFKFKIIKPCQIMNKTGISV